MPKATAKPKGTQLVRWRALAATATTSHPTATIPSTTPNQGQILAFGVDSEPSDMPNDLPRSAGTYVPPIRRLVRGQIQFSTSTLTVSPAQNGESSRRTGIASRRSPETTLSIRCCEPPT
jgi:hypothetical protein